MICPAPQWIHDRNLCNCRALAAKRERDADQPEPRMRIGMGAGSYGRPAEDDRLDSPKHRQGDK